MLLVISLLAALLTLPTVLGGSGYSIGGAALIVLLQWFFTTLSIIFVSLVAVRRYFQQRSEFSDAQIIVAVICTLFAVFGIAYRFLSM